MFLTTTIALKDLKPSNILITLPNADSVIQRYITEVSGSDKSLPMPKSSTPVTLSHPLISFSFDDLQNVNGMPPNCEIQLTDFGTGE